MSRRREQMQTTPLGRHAYLCLTTFKAEHMREKAVRHTPWSPEDEALLLKNKKLPTEELIKLFPDRTEAAVTLKKKRWKQWAQIDK